MDDAPTLRTGEGESGQRARLRLPLRLAAMALAFSVVHAVFLLISVAVLPSLGWSLLVSVVLLAAIVTATETLHPSAGREPGHTKSSPSRRPLGRTPVIFIVCTAAVCLSAVAAFAPRPYAAQQPGPDSSFTVTLPDGGHLAGRSYGQPTDRSPLVVVHGGPGIPLSPAEERFLPDLAGDRQVFVYDQVGTGRSSRLSDPEDYTFARAVSDLRSFVTYIGASRVSILGYSWGAQVATAYAARFPEHLARLVLVSPGPFPWADEKWPPQGPQSRLTTGQKLRVYAEAIKPRNLFLYAVTAVRPGATRWFASEQELNSRFHRLYQLSADGLSCGPLHHYDLQGLGYFAHEVPQLHPDGSGVRRGELRQLRRTPTLVVRGECDYIDAKIARVYEGQLAQSELVQLAGAGHALLVERPDAAKRILRRFLEDA